MLLRNTLITFFSEQDGLGSLADFDLGEFGDLGSLDLNNNNSLNDLLGDIFKEFSDDFDKGEKVSNEVFYTLVIIYGVVISLGLIGKATHILFLNFTTRGLLIFSHP